MPTKKNLRHQDIISDYRKVYMVGSILPIVAGLLGEMLIVSVLSFRNPICFVLFPASIMLIFGGTWKLGKTLNELKRLKNREYLVCISDSSNGNGTTKKIVIRIPEKTKPLIQYNAEAYDIEQDLAT